MFLFKTGSPSPFGQFKPSSGGFMLLWYGCILILFGVAILIEPDLLAFIVSLILIVLGSLLIYFWWKMKKAQKIFRFQKD